MCLPTTQYIDSHCWYSRKLLIQPPHPPVNDILLCIKWKMFCFVYKYSTCIVSLIQTCQLSERPLVPGRSNKWLPTVHAATSFSCGFLPRSWKHIPILQWQRSMALSTSWDYLVCSSPHTQCIVLVMIESFTTNNWSLYRYEQLVDHSIECPVRHWGMDVCIRTWFLMFVILTVLVPHDYHVKTWKFNLCMGDLYCTLIISKVP